MDFIVAQTMDELGRIRLPEAHRKFLFIKRETQMDILPIHKKQELHLIWPEDQEGHNFSGFDRKISIDWKVALPRDLRHMYGFVFEDMLYTYMESGKMIVTKTLPVVPDVHCTFCLSHEDLQPTPVIYRAVKPANRAHLVLQCPYCMQHTIPKLIEQRDKNLEPKPDVIDSGYIDTAFPFLAIKTINTQ